MANDPFDYSAGSSGLFDGGGTDTDTDIVAWLDQSQDAHRTQLEQERAQVTHQLCDRKEIHRQIVEDLAWNLERYTDRLHTLYRRGTGRHDRTREQVKDRITEFEAALHEEYRAHWQDRQALEQERREIRRELAELDETAWSELL